MLYIGRTEIKYMEYPNGEAGITLNSINDALEQNDTTNISLRYENDGDLVRLRFIESYYLENDIVADLNVLYMPYSRMDRTGGNNLFTLKYTIEEFFSNLSFDNIYILEPHSDVTLKLFKENNITCHAVSPFEDILKIAKEKSDFDEDNDVIMFPDAGANSRYAKYITNDIVVGEKVRNFKTMTIDRLSIKDSPDLTGKTVIIMDDLSSYGGTFIRSSIALKKLGATKIYLGVAHAENVIFAGELFEHIDGMVATDSILTEAHYPTNALKAQKLTVLDSITLIEKLKGIN